LTIIERVYPRSLNTLSWTRLLIRPRGVEKENFLLDDTRRDRRSDLSKEVRERAEGGEWSDGLMMRSGAGDYTKVSLKEQ
jgi:hypothetical protein